MPLVTGNFAIVLQEILKVNFCCQEEKYFSGSAASLQTLGFLLFYLHVIRYVPPSGTCLVNTKLPSRYFMYKSSAHPEKCFVECKMDVAGDTYDMRK